MPSSRLSLPVCLFLFPPSCLTAVCVCLWTRRTLDTHQGVSQVPAEEAMQRDDVHVAFICTENLSHEDNIR